MPSPSRSSPSPSPSSSRDTTLEWIAVILVGLLLLALILSLGSCSLARDASATMGDVRDVVAQVREDYQVVREQVRAKLELWEAVSGAAGLALLAILRNWLSDRRKSKLEQRVAQLEGSPAPK